MKTIKELAAEAVTIEINATSGPDVGRVLVDGEATHGWYSIAMVEQYQKSTRALVATAARIAVEFMQQQDAREGMPGRDPVGLRDPVPGASGSPAQSPGPVTAVAPEREAPPVDEQQAPDDL